MNFMHLFVVKQLPVVCCQSLQTQCDITYKYIQCSSHYLI